MAVPQVQIDPTRIVGASGVSEITGTQRAGLALAWAVGIAIAVVLASLLVTLFVQPGTPALPAHPAPAALPTVLAQYEAATNATWDRVSKAYDLIIARSLLPVFTLILGYIFGARSSSER